MNRFRYLRDELFLIGVAVYALNRWVLKPWLETPFLTGYLNDVLVIPAALPVVLWVQRRLGLRTHDGPPSWSEITLHLLVWSVICEYVGPRWFHRGTADPWDVVAYAAGGLLAGFWWNLRSTKRGTES